MPPFRWEDIDHRLVVLKLVDLSEEMRSRIKADESRIRFENRLNLNSNTVPSLVLQMNEEHADEWARREYEIYCEVWQTQGYVKSAGFVRSIGARIVRMLGVRAKSIANEFSRFAGRTNFPGSLTTVHLRSLDLRMRQLQGRWQRRLEIEAKECEYSEKRLKASQPVRQSARDTTETPREKLPEPFWQPSAGESRQPADVSTGMPKRRKPGRSPRLPEAFVVLAGTLWRGAISSSHTKVSNDQLLQIASALDAAGHSPPGSYLEGKYARDLKDFNSRNSNSKIGPLKTWLQLVSQGDKDHLQGMRRMLSRCAEKLNEHHPPSEI
jgi:hypothetical protein